MQNQNTTTSLLLTPPQLDGETALAMVKRHLNSIDQWSNLVLPHPDVMVLNQEGSSLKIETVREMLINAQYQPYQASERIIILLFLDQATLPAQQALLKFFEEPPSYVRVIATASNLQSVLPTIQSRSVLFDATQSSDLEHTNQNSQKPLPDMCDTLSKLKQCSYSDCIDLSEQYKERPEAISFLQQLLDMVRTDTTYSLHYPSAQTVAIGQLLLTHLRYLHQNSNVRLTVESCLFAIKKRF